MLCDSVLLTLDGNDELRDDGEDLGLAVGEQVVHALDRQEPVWVLLLADALHEDWQVVMVVELLDLNLPCDPVGEAVLDLDGQVAAIVEATELTGWDDSLIRRAGSWREDSGLLLRLVQRADFTSTSLTFLGVICDLKSDNALVRDTLMLMGMQPCSLQLSIYFNSVTLPLDQEHFVLFEIQNLKERGAFLNAGGSFLAKRKFCNGLCNIFSSRDTHYSPKCDQIV